MASEHPAVARANGLITVQMAPDQIVAALSLEFADDLRTPQIEQAVTEVEQRIKAAHPEVVSLFIKPQTLKTFQEKQRVLEAGRR